MKTIISKSFLFILGALIIMQILSSCKKRTLEFPERKEFYLKNNTNYCYTVQWGCSYDVLPSNLYNPTNPYEIPPIMIKILCPNDSFNLCNFVYKNAKLYIYHIDYMNYVRLYNNNINIVFKRDTIINYKISIYNINNWQKKETHNIVQVKDEYGNSELYNSTPYVFCIDSTNIINYK